MSDVEKMFFDLCVVFNVNVVLFNSFLPFNTLFLLSVIQIFLCDKTEIMSRCTSLALTPTQKSISSVYFAFAWFTALLPFNFFFIFLHRCFYCIFMLSSLDLMKDKNYKREKEKKSIYGDRNRIIMNVDELWCNDVIDKNGRLLTRADQ